MWGRAVEIGADDIAELMKSEMQYCRDALTGLAAAVDGSNERAIKARNDLLRVDPGSMSRLESHLADYFDAAAIGWDLLLKGESAGFALATRQRLEVLVRIAREIGFPFMRGVTSADGPVVEPDDRWHLTGAHDPTPVPAAPSVFVPCSVCMSKTKHHLATVPDGNLAIGIPVVSWFTGPLWQTKATMLLCAGCSTGIRLGSAGAQAVMSGANWPTIASRG